MFFVSHASATAYALVNKAVDHGVGLSRQRLWVLTHTHTRYSLFATCRIVTALRVTEMPHRIELR
jgi:alanyl-tRNA synthetase